MDPKCFDRKLATWQNEYFHDNAFQRKSKLFGIKEMLPFLFPSHSFRHTHRYITWMQRCHHKPLALFVLQSLCHVTSSMLNWSFKWEGRWGCFTGNSIQAEIQGFRKKKKERISRLLFFLFHKIFLQLSESIFRVFESLWVSEKLNISFKNVPLFLIRYHVIFCCN